MGFADGQLVILLVHLAWGRFRMGWWRIWCVFEVWSAWDPSGLFVMGTFVRGLAAHLVCWQVT